MFKVKNAIYFQDKTKGLFAFENSKPKLISNAPEILNDIVVGFFPIEEHFIVISDQTNQPLYPFGFGLSYTKFKYDNLKVENTFAENKTVKVSVEITNTGKYKGKEVTQLYIRDLFASVTRPIREF